MGALGPIVLGIIDAFIVAVLLLLVGALIAWVCEWFGYPIPQNIQKLYMGLVLLVLIYLIVAALFGLSTLHVLGGRAHALFVPNSMDAVLTYSARA